LSAVLLSTVVQPTIVTHDLTCDEWCHRNLNSCSHPRLVPADAARFPRPDAEATRIRHHVVKCKLTRDEPRSLAISVPVLGVRAKPNYENAELGETDPAEVEANRCGYLCDGVGNQPIRIPGEDHPVESVLRCTNRVLVKRVGRRSIGHPLIDRRDCPTIHSPWFDHDHSMASQRLTSRTSRRCPLLRTRPTFQDMMMEVRVATPVRSLPDWHMTCAMPSFLGQTQKWKCACQHHQCRESTHSILAQVLQ
jgi:hypothetical protein